MQKTILVTGATDGIGLETVKNLVSLGHNVLLHGRNEKKLAATEKVLSEIPNARPVESYVADLSRLSGVEELAKAVSAKHDKLDVLINNAGVYSVKDPITDDGLDVRFVVNTIAPFVLTRRLLPLMGRGARVVNVSSAAQADVDPKAILGEVRLAEGPAYAQSKLALMMWTNDLVKSLKDNGPMVVSVNPGSLLASKMVKDAFGVPGSDLSIGADILTRAALSEEFESASGKYYDNDAKQFGPPHPEANDAQKIAEVVRAIEAVIESVGV